jgi:hypothetical protein
MLLNSSTYKLNESVILAADSGVLVQDCGLMYQASKFVEECGAAIFDRISQTLALYRLYAAIICDHLRSLEIICDHSAITYNIAENVCNKQQQMT